ncbi:MAG: copper-containing nitrite reductase [Sphaerobacter sp.]|nr:copper-containing nitrite reductase [Sphaerobacter sp.]
MQRRHLDKRTIRLTIAALSIVVLLIGAAAFELPRARQADDSGGHAAAAPSAVQPAPAELARLAQPEVAPPVGARGPQLVSFELEAKEVVAAIDEGVAYRFWTFNGTVPGPMLRVRQGDTVELTLKNALDATAPHNIDLHAVTGPGGGAAATTVSPGKQATIRFQAMHPGVYVYHCATPPAPMHIANGMYGLIVVEPEGGLPPVDREFYVMQGDFYLSGDRGQPGLHGFDMEQMLAEDPDYVVFNGAVGALTGDRALQAKTGETVRIFFGVGGPNLTSSFHVIGEVFDRVAPEAANAWVEHVQTTLVPAGGATIVELQTDVPGDYTLVDHSLGRVMKGAAATLHVEGPANPEVFTVIEHGDQAGGH